MCGSYFQPEKEDTFAGPALCGFLGPEIKTAHWHLFYTNGHETHDIQVSESADCFFPNHGCYPGYDDPTWVDPNRNTWNQVTHAPSYVSSRGGCVYDSPYKTDHQVPYYCSAQEAPDEETCAANNWYWNFTNSTCQSTPWYDPCNDGWPEGSACYRDNDCFCNLW